MALFKYEVMTKSTFFFTNVVMSVLKSVYIMTKLINNSKVPPDVNL